MASNSATDALQTKGTVETIETVNNRTPSINHSIPDTALPSRWPPSVSIIVPTFNEADNLDELITRCETALQDHPHEIIIVDDDSPDNTWRIASLLYDDHPHIRVIRRTNEKGLATAVSRGMTEATNEFCTVLDADLQHPPEEIPRLLRHIEPGVDLVIGSRYTDFGSIENWSHFRKLVSQGAAALTKASLPAAKELTDPMSGFFVVRQSLIDEAQLSPTGYKILLEVLVRCNPRDVVEVPYIFQERERGESKLTASEYLDFLTHLATLRRDTQ